MRYIVLLAIAAILSLSIGATGASAEGCGVVKDKGRLAAGENVSFASESDCGGSLVGWIEWGRYDPDKDISVTVVSPSGLTLVFDDGPSSAQTFIIFGPVEVGEYTVTITNVGTERLRYELTFGFG